MSKGKGTVAGLLRWARLRGRSAFVVVGALDGEPAGRFVARLRAGDVLPIPVDAIDIRHADVLVVAGRVSPRLAVLLRTARQRLVPGGVVLAFDTDDDDESTACRVDRVIEVDVLVRGMPPTEEMLGRALVALDDAFVAVVDQARNRSNDDVAAEPA
jgi:hypothetical protein